MLLVSTLIPILSACSDESPVKCTEANCSRCHGSDGDPAPPPDTAGRQGTDSITVGAHASHLEPSDWHAPISCTECHVVPACLDDPGHIDTDAPAEITWGSLATSRGASPSFDRSAGTCSGVYCHGSTLTGGTLEGPTWTVVDSTQDACGTCHGLPPDPPHPSTSACSTCHASVIDASMSFIDPSLHVNGSPDF